jgi:hypothetical protein
MKERGNVIRTSIIVNAQGRKRPERLSWALCTLPRILAVPTPRATPANRVSIKRIRLDKKDC